MYEHNLAQLKDKTSVDVAECGESVRVLTDIEDVVPIERPLVR